MPSVADVQKYVPLIVFESRGTKPESFESSCRHDASVCLINQSHDPSHSRKTCLMPSRIPARATGLAKHAQRKAKTSSRDLEAR